MNNPKELMTGQTQPRRKPNRCLISLSAHNSCQSHLLYVSGASAWAAEKRWG